MLAASVALPDGQVMFPLDPERHPAGNAYQARVARYAHCAPAGARFIPAPLMDFQHVSCGQATSMNVGPCKALREARMARGNHPLVPGEKVSA